MYYGIVQVVNGSISLTMHTLQPRLLSFQFLVAHHLACSPGRFPSHEVNGHLMEVKASTCQKNGSLLVQVLYTFSEEGFNVQPHVHWLHSAIADLVCRAIDCHAHLSDVRVQM